MNLPIAAWLAFAALLFQSGIDPNSGYRTKAGREQVAANLASPDRPERVKPQAIVDAMEVQPGMTVADIGTGIGFLLPYLSKAVGDEGKVLAEDIYSDFLEKAQANAAAQKLDNIEFILGHEKDPRLPEGAVDAVVVVDTYHHFDYPSSVLAAIRRALRPQGRLVIVDYYRRPDAMPGGNAMSHIRLDEPEVLREVESKGFRLLKKKEHVRNSHYLLVLVK